MTLLQLAIAAGLLALWTAALLVRDRWALPAMGDAHVKFTHALPAVLQVTLFAYWSLYWSAVVAHVPVVLAQLAFAYAVDVLLAWTRRRPYQPSLGPIPIVLSANLFVWFPPEQALLGFVVVAVALASKAWLRAGDRHIFNPSVLGIAVVGVLCVILPDTFRYHDISHDFDRPPQMALVILVLALIPQVRLNTTPVAVGAAVAMIGTMVLVGTLTGYHGGPSPWWPPWLLAITLLAGDPATIPSGSLPRLLFGVFLGIAFYVVSRGMLVAIGTDFYAKILPIPLANLLVPVFARVGHQLTAHGPLLLRTAGAHAYVAVWVSLSALMLFVSRRV